jgi:AraC family transcriptional regulator
VGLDPAAVHLQGRGLDGVPRTVDITVNYIYSSWLLGSGKKHTGGPDLEIYGAEYQMESEQSAFRYAIPIK